LGHAGVCRGPQNGEPGAGLTARTGHATSPCPINHTYRCLEQFKFGCTGVTCYDQCAKDRIFDYDYEHVKHQV
jgi:hypothetical protein